MPWFFWVLGFFILLRLLFYFANDNRPRSTYDYTRSPRWNRDVQRQRYR